MEPTRKPHVVVIRSGQGVERVEVDPNATPQQIAGLVDFISKGGRARATNLAKPAPQDGTQTPRLRDPFPTPEIEPQPVQRFEQGDEPPLDPMLLETLSKIALETRSVAPPLATDSHLTYGLDPEAAPENLPSLPLQPPTGSKGRIFNFRPSPSGVSAIPEDLLGSTVGAVGAGLNDMASATDKMRQQRIAQDQSVDENGFPLPPPISDSGEVLNPVGHSHEMSPTGDRVYGRIQKLMNATGPIGDFLANRGIQAPELVEFLSGFVTAGFGAANAVSPFLRSLTAGSSALTRTGEELGTDVPGKIVHGVMAPITSASDPRTKEDAALTGLLDAGLLLGASGFQFKGKNVGLVKAANKGLGAVEALNIPPRMLAYPGLRVESAVRKALSGELPPRSADVAKVPEINSEGLPPLELPFNAVASRLGAAHAQRGIAGKVRDFLQDENTAPPVEMPGARGEILSARLGAKSPLKKKTEEPTQLNRAETVELMRLRTKRTKLTKSETARLEELDARLREHGAPSKLGGEEAEGLSGMSQAGQSAIKKGEYEKVTEDAVPDAILEGVGGIPTSYDVKTKTLRVGKDAEIHYDFLRRYYEEQGLPKDQAIMRAQTELRNSKYPSARITPDKKFVAVWGSTRDHKQQHIADMLFEMVRKGHLDKDARVSFAGRGQQFTVREAIEGTAPGFINATVFPGLLKFVERDKQNPAFKKWFGKSQLVEANGDPKIMFHGSTSPDGVEVPKMGSPFNLGLHVGTLGQAQARLDYVTSNTATGRNEHLVPLYVRAEKPLRLTDVGTWYPDVIATELLKLPGAKGLSEKTRQSLEEVIRFGEDNVEGNFVDGDQQTVIDAIRELGYDSIVYKNKAEKDGGLSKDSYILLDPNQAKSVTGNRGTFSTTDPSILKADLNPFKDMVERKKGEIGEADILREDFPEHEGIGTHEALKKNIESLNERGIEPVSAKESESRALDRFAAATHDLVRQRVTEEGEGRTSWYQKHGQIYVPKVARDKPELKLDDPANREMFALLGSVLSNGNSVRQEVQKQIQYFGDYLKKGKFNAKGDFGARNASISASLVRMNKLLKHFGSPEEMMRWMDAEHSVGEINATLKAAGVDATVENVNGRGKPQYGATVLGPKVGNYQLNKLGNESVVTKDSWMARLWDVVMAEYNPVTKKLFDGRGDSFYQEQMRGMDKFSAAERRTMDEAFRRAAAELNLTPADVQAVLWSEIKTHTAKQIGDDPGLGSHIDFYERSKADAGLREGNAGEGRQPEAAGETADVWGDAAGAGEVSGAAGSGGGYAFAKTGPGSPLKRKPGTKYAGSVNLDRLKGLKKADRARVVKLVERMKPEIDKIIGEDVTFDEILDAAKDAEVWGEAMPRSKKLEMIAQVHKLREVVNYNIQHDVTSAEALQQMRDLQSIANFFGAALGSFRIDAKAADWGVKARLYSKLQKLDADMKAVIEAGKNVDFEDARQVAELYRKFVKPKTSEILDELRYISLLSSPRTHIVNAFSNITQTLGLAPATRLAHAATDWVTSAITGKDRKVFASEVPAYGRGAINAIPQAWAGAADAFLGRKAISQLDLKRVPTVGQAEKAYMKPVSKLNDATRYVLNALEAGDVFFREMVKGGERMALEERARQKGETPDAGKIEEQAEETAAYFVFRKPLDSENKTNQGKLLSQIDKITEQFQGAAAKVPSLRWIVPFVQTPMNIFKQGIEYSPLGFATMKGAGDNKSLQFSKALVGSIVAVGAMQAVASTETTWDVPTDEREKADFYAQGKQPFSIKIGDKWMQITKLGPLAYPIAMAMMAKHSGKDGDNMIVALPVSMLKFFSEQSYMQGLQSLGDAIKEPERFASKFSTSMAKQVIPLSALQRFANNFMDRTQRAPETMGDRMIQDIPGLSKNVPPRITPFGEEAQKPDLTVNLFQLSPLNATRASNDALIQRLEKRGIVVGMPSRKVYGSKLTAEQYNEYATAVGKRFVEEIGAEDASWLSQDEVDRLLINIRHEVRSELFPDLEEEYLDRQDEETDQ